MQLDKGTREPADGSRSSDDLLPKGRLEAFADGVLAIVITILVLELEVPGRSEGAISPTRWPTSGGGSPAT